MMSGETGIPTFNDSKKPVRVYFDGCFDCLHYGHANALRQAKAMGDVLVVGVHSDAVITKHKGRPPICPESERYRMIRGIKYVDEVVEDATYLPDAEMLDKYNCDFCVHGDDNSYNADGGDSYRLVKAAGRFRECKRTPGISTTDIRQRILALTSEASHDATASTVSQQCATSSSSSSSSSNNNKQASYSTMSASDASSSSCFLPTSRFIALFASGIEPKTTDRVVYIAGDFDLFHAGHLELLEKARMEGDYLLVGVHSDDVVRSYRGSPFPVMTLLERTLSILACRCVSEVIVGAPLTITSQMLNLFRVDLVCHGSILFLPQDGVRSPIYLEPVNRGNFKSLEISSDAISVDIMNRVKSSSSL